MMNLPSGTVTFLFTDIEGSTRLWEQFPEQMQTSLMRHDVLVRQVIESHNGYVIKSTGDGILAAFGTAPDALAATLTLQQNIRAEPWPAETPIRIRAALHTGTAEMRDADYYGPTLNRTARIMATGYGGQVLLSLPTCELVRDHLPEGVTLRNLGEHRLKDLGRPETIFQVLHRDLRTDFPPLKSLDNITLPNNLPQQVTTFVGREQEMRAIRELLKKTRLLTLTGPGGTGKTRLSLQVAADIMEEYPDGVWFAELAPLDDPAFAVQTVAHVLQVREEPGKPLLSTLLTALKSRRLLLIMDNAEHLLTACAHLAETLLRHCPNIWILVSSREPLNIVGEHRFRVPTLALPDPKKTVTVDNVSTYESVRLFIERAEAVSPAFIVTNANAPAIAQLCVDLDGIPLAIELAAARVRSLPVEDICQRLNNRFRLLTGGSRTAQPRQQTLRALIDWSYDLLTEQEKTLLQRLSVFSGGWSLEAAESICSDTVSDIASLSPEEGTVGRGFHPPSIRLPTEPRQRISTESGGEPLSYIQYLTPNTQYLIPIEEWEILDLLTSLVDKSLVVYEENAAEGRYRLLETMREYSKDRLQESGDGERVLLQHRNYFLGLVEEAETRWRGPQEKDALDRLESEMDNIRAVFERCCTEADWEKIGLRMAGALGRFWYVRGYVSEGKEFLSRLLARVEELPSESLAQEKAKVLNNAGTLWTVCGDYGRGRDLYQQCLDNLRQVGDRKQMAAVLNNLGYIAHEQGDYGSAQEFFEESLLLYRELEDFWGQATVLNNLGRIPADQGNGIAARPFYEESLALRRRLGDKHGIAMSLNNLGLIAMQQKEWDRAQELLEESLVLRRELDDRYGIGISLKNLAIVDRLRGDYEKARAGLSEAITILNDLEERRELLDALDNVALLLTARQQYARAVTLFGAANALREALGATLRPDQWEEYNQLKTRAQAALSERDAAFAWEAGAAMNIAQAVDFAQENA